MKSLLCCCRIASKLEICHLVIWAQGPQNRMTVTVRETTRDLGWQWRLNACVCISIMKSTPKHLEILRKKQEDNNAATLMTVSISLWETIPLEKMCTKFTQRLQCNGCGDIWVKISNCKNQTNMTFILVQVLCSGHKLPEFWTLDPVQGKIGFTLELDTTTQI